MAVCLTAGACADRPPSKDVGPARKIAYYKKKIADYPRHYPAHTMLAAAYLERARETADPADLGRARASARKSIEIQPSFQAYKTFAMIEGFAHRFEESLTWAEKASKSAIESVPDSDLASIMTDAYLGLGQAEKAEKLLTTFKERDFHTSAAWGHLLKSRGSNDRAAAAFQDAARFARMENAGKAEAWAEVMTAGVWLDAGLPDKALGFIDQAARISPGDKQMLIHRAEYHLAKNQPEKAAEIYRDLLKSSDDPELHGRLFILEQKRADAGMAKLHFNAAVSGYRKAIDAGEIYTVGSLATLLCDAGMRPEDGIRLSEKNLLLKRDKEARNTRKCFEPR